MTSLDAAVVTLVAANIEYRPDGEPWGVFVVRSKEGRTKCYLQCIPQHAHPEPPGWDALADITGISTDAVRTAWDDSGKVNHKALEAFERLRLDIGKDFLTREVAGVADDLAVELIPVRIDDPTVKIDLDEGLVLEGDTPVHFTALTALAPEIDPDNENPPRLVLYSADGAPLVIQIPDTDHESDPPSWFFVETLTGIAARSVAVSWEQVGNVRQSLTLAKAVARLSALLQGRMVPLREDGQVDLDSLRRRLIQERAATDDDPVIFVGRNPKRIVEHAWTLLRDTCGHRLFRYNVERGAHSGLPALVRTVEGQQKLEVIDTKEKMRGILFTHMDFSGAPTRVDGERRHVNPPNVISEHMITFADQTIPAIDTLVRIPTVRKDGTIHDTEGYDPRSRIWYAPELKLDPIPEAPTESDARHALAEIMTPLKEFPFVAEAGSVSATIACLLDQLVRPLVAGPRPIYAFDAPALKGQGTGKTLLATAIGAVITGREVEVTGWPDDPKELPKLITSKLMAGEPFVIFDNLEGTIRHKDLAACATATTWSSRLLHTNEAPKLPQTATWCMTLNGARYSRDIARRIITIKLDTRTADPYKRTGFEIPNLIPWVIQRRARLIRACLILVRAWVTAGRPEDPRLNMGSFEAWRTVVGGILYHAGLRDLPRALEESRDRDVDAVEHDEFVEHWYTQYHHAPVTSLQLAQLAEQYNLYGSVLENVKAPTWKGRHMTEILRKLEGHVFSGREVTRREQKVNGYTMYSLTAPKDEYDMSDIPS